MFPALIGARILKTGIAVTIATFISIQLHVEPVLFAAVSAVLNLQPSVYMSLKNAREQLYIHITGVAVAMFLGFTAGQNPVTMGIATIMEIYLCVKLKLKGSVAMGVVTAIFILNSPTDQFMTHAIGRTAVIFIGLIVALSVNILIMPPKYKDKFLFKIEELNKLVIAVFSEALDSFIHLDQEKAVVWKEKKPVIRSLTAECKELLSLCCEQHEYKRLFGRDMKNEADFFEQYLNLNIELYYKTDSIYALIPQRLQRREEKGNREISSEFNSILAMLERGRQGVESLNRELLQSAFSSEARLQTIFDDEFWEQMSQTVAAWYHNHSGSYYLYAFMEVSVVAQEMRWVAGEMQRLLTLRKEINKLIHGQ